MPNKTLPILIVTGVILVWGFVYLRQPISLAVDTPLMREYARIHDLCVKLRSFADAHTSFPGGATTGTSIDELVMAGVLSANDAAYIHEHQIEYHGLDLRHLTADVPVFETLCTNAIPRRRIVGFGDGHVVMQQMP